jgi:hypothetical protein
MTIKFNELQQRLKEAKQKTMVFSFGRMNPPTIGHEKVVNVIKETASARGADARLYLSHTNDKDKNPLTYDEKAKYAKKAFGIFKKSRARTIIEVGKELEAEGYTDLVLVFGEDRDDVFFKLLNKYNGKDFNFNTIERVSAGKRNPNAKGVEGISGTKLRELARNGEVEEFKKALASKLSDSDKTAIYKKIRSVYSLSDSIEFEPIAIREAYLIGDIFNVGDVVYDMNEDVEYEIVEQGVNFVYVKDENGTIITKWLSDLSERKTAQDDDIEDREGSQPKKYFTGLAKSTKKSRDAHFKKKKEKDDDDPSAYEPAPGDAKAETKPSKYTKKYKQMYGEQAPDTDEALARYKAGKAGFTDVAHLKAKGLIPRADGTKKKSAKYESLEEKLKVSDGLGAWISDFQKSDAPQFKGKSKEERQKMAIAAFVDAGGELNEDVQLDEMPRWVTDLIGKYANPKGYSTAEKILKDILKKKRQQKGRSGLDHSIEYYASVVARQVPGVDARVLADLVELKESVDLIEEPGDDELAKFIDKNIDTHADEWDDIDYLYGDEDEEELNAALSPAERKKRSIQMKRSAKKIARKREISLKKPSSPEKLKQRARKHAINLIRKKLVKGQKYDDLNFAQKEKIERILQKKKATIDKLAVRLAPKLKKLELARLKNINTKEETILEAEYEGRKVELEKPFRMPKGSSKKFGVYVKNDKGNVVKVTFGDPNMEIKRDDEDNLKSFRARHGCDKDPGPKWKAKYWSCKFWEKGVSVTDLLEEEEELQEKQIPGLVKKADASGISYAILKKVYDRGMAAWKGGHRPGTTPQQWAFARVNSFITGGKTRTTADADLWKKHKGA